MGAATTKAPPRRGQRYQLESALGNLTSAERAERGKAGCARGRTHPVTVRTCR